MLKKFVFKKISTIDIPKSSKLHRYVNKVRKLYHARYKCNDKCDPKIINLNKMAIPKKSYLLSFFSRHYQRIMKKCNARRYLSLFSCDCVSYMTNYLNFKLRACLHDRWGDPPHVTSPIRGLPLPRKKALSLFWTKNIPHEAKDHEGAWDKGVVLTLKYAGFFADSYELLNTSLRRKIRFGVNLQIGPFYWS